MNMDKNNTSDLASLDCWDYTIELECLRGPQDLQLAAELGKTLLERNKELETNLRQQQNVVEDRNQEIEYLTKQTAALREVNDSRLRIYEQLEISIQDLERNNQRLVQENLNDKKQIKSLYETIESLESRCEDLQHIVDDMGHTKKDNSIVPDGSSVSGSAATVDDQDEYAKLVSQLKHAKIERAKEQRKVSELEQNVSLLIQENTNLEEKVCVMQQKDEELKTLQDQIVFLEEIRQGNLCRRCQRSTDMNAFDDYSVYDDDDDTDDISAIGSYVETHKHEVLQKLQETLGENYSDDNPYRVLVDKYETLLKIQQKHNAFTSSVCGVGRSQQQPVPMPDNGGGLLDMSLRDELQNLSGEFSSFNGGNASDSEDDETAAETATETGAGDGGGVTAAETAAGNAIGRGGGKYSETETTSSSGFSDETSNKCTQTTETFLAGSFLCTISDGDDCRFSIYDDASPVESRFRKTPEYRQLFREIFAVLKRAAERKDEGEGLPLLQDDDDDDDGNNGGGGYRRSVDAIAAGDDDEDSLTVSVASSAAAIPAAPRVPPATPACEHNPFVASVTAAESLATAGGCEEQPAAAPLRERSFHGSAPCSAAAPASDSPAPAVAAAVIPKQEQQHVRRHRRDIIEELAAVKNKKHARHHHRKSSAAAAASSSSSSKHHQQPSSSRDISHLLEFKWTDKVTARRQCADGPPPPPSSSSSSPHRRATWYGPPAADGDVDRSSSVSPPHGRSEYVSAASQEVAKLKLLDKSYAEVLRQRKPAQTSSSNHHHRNHHHNHNTHQCRPQSQYFGRK